jgi:hypothetical protein
MEVEKKPKSKGPIPSKNKKPKRVSVFYSERLQQRLNRVKGRLSRT